MGKNVKGKSKPTTAQALKAQKKGVNTTRKSKARHTVHFKHKKTLELKRNPKYQRRTIMVREPRRDKFSILRYPLATESAMKKMEENNTLVFIVDLRANKNAIKDAVKQMYNVTATRVNTLITPAGEKKAYVLLSPDFEAMEVANQIGLL